MGPSNSLNSRNDFFCLWRRLKSSFARKSKISDLHFQLDRYVYVSSDGEIQRSVFAVDLIRAVVNVSAKGQISVFVSSKILFRGMK